MHLSDDMRARMIEFLPEAINTAVTSYQLFMKEGHQQADKENPDISKNFKSHHDACKVALAHLELLLKLAQTVEIPKDEVTNEPDKQLFLNSIKKALDEINEKTNPQNNKKEKE